MDLETAIEIVENDVKADTDDYVEAWLFLIRSGHCWTLQGMYGHQASIIIENGVRSMAEFELTCVEKPAESDEESCEPGRGTSMIDLQIKDELYRRDLENKSDED